MKYILISLLALLCLTGAQCNQPVPNPPPPEPEPTVWPDAPPPPNPTPAPPLPPVPSVPPSAGDACDKAEETATSLGCPLKGSGSASWADVCRNAAKNGVTMHQKCVVAATDCKQVAFCLKSTK